MNQHSPGGLMIILGTFIVALMLSQIPLPRMLEWWRPEFVALFVIYWIMALPQRFGVGSAWIIGLLLDVLKGSVLGINAIALTLIAYCALLMHKRLRMFPLWQQALVIFLLIVANQLIFYWLQALAGTKADDLQFLIPAVVSALLWPWVFVLLRGIRRTFKIS
ncbi:MAG: rod shape-determining protein MreD [Pseudomonadales bacterium]|nr:rod shape-determining protein MreD [Pseudomonadales bacterium]NRA18683.1 rod shape-determining protein MreD [Oceanospirillaceae bacterium]